MAILGSAGFMISGCGGSDNTVDTEVVARINDYNLTVSDFENEAKPAFIKKRILRDPLKAKKELLEDVITRKILLQEAQKENFDKEKKFMREIEGYWEQALLKLLIHKKTEEFSEGITVRESEIKDEYLRLLEEGSGKKGGYEKMVPDIKKYIYHKKIEEALGEWVGDLRDKAKIEINEKTLEKIQVR